MDDGAEEAHGPRCIDRHLMEVWVIPSSDVDGAYRGSARLEEDRIVSGTDMNIYVINWLIF